MNMSFHINKVKTIESTDWMMLKSMNY